MRRVGLVVNPVAGLGGSVALKGSDTLEIQRQALALGAVPRAPERAEAALRALVRVMAPTSGTTPPEGFKLLVAPGLMGEVEAEATQLPALVVGAPGEGGDTTAADTRAAVRGMVSAGAELILFAGGDGTARDVHDALSAAGDGVADDPHSGSAGPVPVVGIPAGCKIHSAVYATSPAAAGELAGRYLTGTTTACADLEVMDIDEAAFREGQVRARLHGFLRVPDERRLIQGAKIGGRSLSDGAAAQAIAERIVESMEAGRVYVIGPGTTTRAIKHRMGLEGTLLGVDAVRDGRLVARDATEAELLALLSQPVPACIVVAMIGGQGAILGRGNQQLSPTVVRRVGLDNIVVVATQAKVAALPQSRLLVDTGDPALDAELAGYRRVITGYREEAVLRVV